MKPIRFILTLCALAAAAAVSAQPDMRFNRAPLQPRPYAELPIGAVKPAGWLGEQLVRMRDGMTGHLDSLYPQVMGPRNGWLGGDGDVWERGPYWIDGLLPLAYILEDERLIAKVKPWVEWALASQTADGNFGPVTDRLAEPGLQRDKARDWWPRMVVLKVLQQYHSATGDRRVLDFMDRYFRYQLAQLPRTPLDNWTKWGRQPGGDNLAVVYWLYNLTGEKYLLELGELIHKQTFDWTGAFLHGDHLSRPYSLHCVDLGQGFKEPAVYWQQSGDSRHLAAVGRAVEKMRHTIGLPTGLWAGDEKLRFGDPTLGSELCTAVEMMFSLEQILQITGGREWGDYLERVAYNALPTQTTDAQDARQYYQQINQVEVTRKVRPFSTPHEDTDIVFGLCTGYPCCTSNLHQGWPKLVQNLWYATRDGGLAALVYAPSTVETTAGGMKVAIEERTDYPFRERIAFRVTLPGAGKRATAAFPLHLRIPGWCAEPGITLNGEKVAFRNVGEGIVVVERAWRSGDCLNVTFPACVAVRRWYDEAAVVERGPLVYALRMDEKWERREMEPGKQAFYGPYYYEVTSDSPWNFCLPKANVRPEAVAESFVVEDDGEMAPYPWTLDGSPVKIRTRANRLGDWTLYSGSAGPIAFVSSQRMYMSPEEEWIELIPYGCTTLRITEFPVH